MIEAQGAKFIIINPYHFRIIKDSWKKTDKNDSRNMAKALRVHLVTGEFGLPEVHKTEKRVRELRKLYSQYKNANKHINMLKNNIQSGLLDDGIVLTSERKNKLLVEKTGREFLKYLDITKATRISIEVSLDI